jgi:hypothetical protein
MGSLIMEIGTAILVIGVLWLMVVSPGFRIVGLVAGALVVSAFAWSEYWPRHVIDRSKGAFAEGNWFWGDRPSPPPPVTASPAAPDEQTIQAPSSPPPAKPSEAEIAAKYPWITPGADCTKYTAGNWLRIACDEIARQKSTQGSPPSEATLAGRQK